MHGKYRVHRIVFCMENDSKDNILPRSDVLLQNAKKTMHPAEASVSLVSVT